MYKNCTFLNTLRIVKTLTINSGRVFLIISQSINSAPVQNQTGAPIVVLMCFFDKNAEKRTAAKAAVPGIFCGFAYSTVVYMKYL